MVTNSLGFSRKDGPLSQDFVYIFGEFDPNYTGLFSFSVKLKTRVESLCRAVGGKDGRTRQLWAGEGLRGADAF